MSLLGSTVSPPPVLSQTLNNLVSITPPEAFHSSLTVEVTTEEISQIVRSMPNNKSPGPDGFNSEFFKSTWEVTGELVTSSVKEFFHTGKLRKEFNATLITLVPKFHHPSRVTDYRPISCCNVFL